MPAGRKPTKKEDCLPKDWENQILEMSAEGMSDVEIRARLCLGGSFKGKFNHKIWDALQVRDSEFRATIQKGKLLCQAWWEAKGRDHLFHGKENIFETGAWYANMKNRFGWRDKTEVEGDSLKKIANALQAIRARRESQ